MKKRNILLPLVTLASAGAVVTPLTTLTSCGTDKGIDLVYKQYEPKDVTPLPDDTQNMFEASRLYYEALGKNPNMFYEDMMWGSSYWIQATKKYESAITWDFCNFKITNLSIKEYPFSSANELDAIYFDTKTNVWKNGKIKKDYMYLISYIQEGEYRNTIKVRNDDLKYVETITHEGEIYYEYENIPFYVRAEKAFIDGPVLYHLRIDNLDEKTIKANHEEDPTPGLWTEGIPKLLTQTEKTAKWRIKYKSTHVYNVNWHFDKEAGRDDEYQNYSGNGKYTIENGQEYDDLLDTQSEFFWRAWQPTASYYLKNLKTEAYAK